MDPVLEHRRDIGWRIDSVLGGNPDIVVTD